MRGGSAERAGLPMQILYCIVPFLIRHMGHARGHALDPLGLFAPNFELYSILPPKIAFEPIIHLL